MSARFALLLALLLPLAPLGASAATAATPAPAASPVEGRDYSVIASGKPFAPVAGKMEVAELFSYACPHCAHFEPMLEAWQAKLPKDAYVTFVPVVYELDNPLAQAYFGAQALGQLATTHQATFDAIHVSENLPRNPTLGEMASFYATLGVNQAKFNAAVASPAVKARLQQAHAFALASQLEGTPSLVVNGKYLVRGETLEDQLRIAGELLARERRLRGR